MRHTATPVQAPLEVLASRHHVTARGVERTAIFRDDRGRADGAAHAVRGIKRWRRLVHASPPSHARGEWGRFVNRNLSFLAMFPIPDKRSASGGAMHSVINHNKPVIPAKAGIQKGSGFRVKPGMTTCTVLMSPCIPMAMGKIGKSPRAL